MPPRHMRHGTPAPHVKGRDKAVSDVSKQLASSAARRTPDGRTALELLRSAMSQRTRGKHSVTLRDIETITPRTKLEAATEAQAAADAVAVQCIFDERLLQLVREQPELLRSLPGSVFEELMAEILAFLGFSDISLRVTTDLGEVDIVGFTKDHFGSRIAYLFELKQRGASGKPVELREITRLYGLREGLRHRLGLTQGAFVTTTTYTAAAVEAGELHGLSLSSYHELASWLSEYKAAPNGLYLRRQRGS